MLYSYSLFFPSYQLTLWNVEFCEYLLICRTCRQLWLCSGMQCVIYLVYPGYLCELFLDIFERFGVFYVCVKIFHNVDYQLHI